MRFKTMLLLVGVFCLAISPAFAKSPEKSSPYRYDSHNISQRAYFEGFEGVFPPAGWTQTVTNPSYTWYKNGLSYYEGIYAAGIGWQAGFPQNETLSFDYFIDVGAGENGLYFWNMGSTYWAVNANFTCTVNGVEVYNFLAEAAGSWIWEQASVDLSAYDGQTVTVAFNYAGDDGADHHLDAVSIAYYEPPPPPPPGDECSTVIDMQQQGLVTWTIDLCDGYSNDFTVPSGGCTGYTAAGTDAVYSIYLLAGETFTASQQGAHDSAIYLVTDCFDPLNSCVAGADATVNGEVETFTYVAAAEGWYYLVIDGYSGCSLTTVWIDNPIPTETNSWGGVKSMYR
ncbi:MAG: hypothetical protein ABIF77_05090 [bacterium]